MKVINRCPLSFAVTLTGLGINLSAMLVNLSGGNLLFLALLTGVTSYILGMGISAIVSYILLATLVAPAMVQAGVPELAAHFSIFYMGCSTFITPPYAIAAFVTANIAGANPFKTSFQAMRLAIVAYLIPFTIIYNPILLVNRQAPWQDVLMAAGAALIATYALSVGVEGYFLQKAHGAERILCLASGLLLFAPTILKFSPTR